MIALILLIIILGILIFVHELGHFVTAKNRGAYVYEFALGMGPKIFSFKRKKETGDPTVYSLRLLPIGGFCAIAGEVDEEDGGDVKLRKDEYMCNKKIWERCLILIAGVTMNFLVGILILFISGLIWGSTEQKSYVGSAPEEYPVYQAGIEVGDRIISIDGHKTNTWDKITIVLNLKHEGNDYVFKVQKKDGSIKDYTVTPKEEMIVSLNKGKADDFSKIEYLSEEQSKAIVDYRETNGTFEKIEDIKNVSNIDDLTYEKIKNRLTLKDENTTNFVFGIGQPLERKKGFIQACSYAFYKTGSILSSMGIVIGSLVTGQLSMNALAGPIGVYSVVGEAAKTSVESVLYLMAYLSLNLGFVNILPFPAFDGGRVLFLIIEGIRKKKMNPKIENTINAIGFALLMLLMIVISIKDILNLF